jgi:hypothetical protein
MPAPTAASKPLVPDPVPPPVPGAPAGVPVPGVVPNVLGVVGPKPVGDCEGDTVGLTESDGETLGLGVTVLLVLGDALAVSVVLGLTLGEVDGVELVLAVLLGVAAAATAPGETLNTARTMAAKNVSAPVNSPTTPAVCTAGQLMRQDPNKLCSIPQPVSAQLPPPSPNTRKQPVCPTVVCRQDE